MKSLSKKLSYSALAFLALSQFSDATCIVSNVIGGGFQAATSEPDNKVGRRNCDIFKTYVNSDNSFAAVVRTRANARRGCLVYVYTNGQAVVNSEMPLDSNGACFNEIPGVQVVIDGQTTAVGGFAEIKP